MLMDLTLYPHAELEQSLLPRLHDAERARYRAFTHPRRRRTWLAGRALALATLTRQSGEADAAALRTDPEGGVRYDDDSFYLSLSHCRDLVAVALSRIRIGVDLEWPRPRALLQHSEKVFTDVEAERLRSLPDMERTDAFYAVWTLKEAACKAAGISLWQSLRNTCFDPGTGHFSSQLPFPVGHWRFMSAGIEPGWCLAIAARDARDDSRIECWRMTAPAQWNRQPLVRQMFLQGK